MELFFPLKLQLHRQKNIQISQPQIHFVTQKNPNFLELFQRYLTFIVLAKTIRGFKGKF